MRRKASIWLLIALMTAGGILPGCSSLKKSLAAQPINGKDSIKNYEGTVKLEELDRIFSDGQGDFAYRIFDALEDGENIFLSPYSISTALSMLYNGADQESRDEMARLLGYDKLPGYTVEYQEAANHYVNANHQLLTQLLGTADPKVKINAANSIWLKQGEKFSNQIEKALLAPVRYYYGGDIFEVDFRKEKTLKEVNQWVSDKTEGMIDPFLDQFADPEMLRVFLANAVYFNGEWTLPFEPKDTREAPFFREAGTSRVRMMHIFDEKFRYYREGDLQGIELPYGNETIVMNVLLPLDKEQSIRKLYKDWTPVETEDFLHKLDQAPKAKINTLGIPRFELEYGPMDLGDALAELGMRKAFLPKEADFELIGKDLYVSSVVHKAVIKVEEWGTEASAATGITMDTGSAMPVEPPLNFIADVPFLFFIRDKSTDTILFMGSLMQP